MPLLAVDFIAEQLGISVSAWFDYSLKGHSGKRDCQQSRASLGFRPATAADGQAIQAWLIDDIILHDLKTPTPYKAAILKWCRIHCIEPPTHERIDRMVGAAVKRFEKTFCADVQNRLPVAIRQRLDALFTPTITTMNWR